MSIVARRYETLFILNSELVDEALTTATLANREHAVRVDLAFDDAGQDKEKFNSSEICCLYHKADEMKDFDVRFSPGAYKRFQYYNDDFFGKLYERYFDKDLIRCAISKLITYILPCFAPLSLLFGYAFRDSDQEAGISIYPIAALWAFIGMVLIAFSLIAPAEMVQHAPHPQNLTPFLKNGIYMGAIIMAGALAGIILARKIGAVPGYAILGLTLMVACLTYAGSWDQGKSTKALLKDFPPDAQLYAYSRYFQSSTFYTRRPVRLVGNMDELTFGQTHDNSNTIGKGVFLDLVQKGEHIYCLTEADHATEITDRAPSARILAQDDRHVLIECFAPITKNKLQSPQTIK